MATRILFVCTGNTCRSPLAEGMLRRMAEQAGVSLEVRSAGVSAMTGSPISKISQTILARKGATGIFRSNALTSELVRWADLILTMTGGHKGTLIARFPEAVDKTHTLKEFAEGDGQSSEHRQVRESLIAELEIKQALGQKVEPAERDRLYKLERAMPNYDISDPFGGDEREYERCAEEIEASLGKLLCRLKEENE